MTASSKATYKECKECLCKTCTNSECVKTSCCICDAFGSAMPTFVCAKCHKCKDEPKHGGGK